MCSNLYNFVTIKEILSYGNGILIDMIGVVKNTKHCSNIDFEDYSEYNDLVTS